MWRYAFAVVLGALFTLPAIAQVPVGPIGLAGSSIVGTCATAGAIADYPTAGATVNCNKAPSFQGIMYSAGVWGAVGDDSTDDSQKVNDAIAALNTAGGGTLCFPPGKKYLLNSQILMPNDSGSPLPRQTDIRLTTCGGGGVVWEYDGRTGTPQYTAATLDLRYNGNNGGKITSLGLGALRIDGLTITDGGSPVSVSVTEGTLTNIVVTGNVAVATFAAPPTCGFYVGAQYVVSGSTTSALNGNYRLTAASGSTITFKTSGVSNGTYNNGALTLKCSAPFIYTTNTTVTIDHDTFLGDGSGGENAIVFGGMSASTGSTITGAFQGYASTVENSVFSGLNSLAVLQTYANAIVVQNNSFVHNNGTAVVQCDASNAGGSGNTSNVFTGNLFEMDTYVYGYILDGCFGNLFSTAFIDAGSSVSAYYNFLATGGSSTNNFFFQNGLRSKRLAAGNTTSSFSNTFITPEGAAPAFSTTVTGSVGQEINNALVVKSTTAASGVDGTLPGGIVAIDPASTNKYTMMGYDAADDYGVIDAYLFGGGAAKAIHYNTSGGAAVFGGHVLSHSLSSTTSSGGKNAVCIDATTGELFQSNAPTC